MPNPTNKTLESPVSIDSSQADDLQAQVAYHVLKGDNFWYRGEMEEAVASYYQALAIDAKTVIAHQKLGKILKQQGKIAESLNHYHQAVSLGMDAVDTSEKTNIQNGEESSENKEQSQSLNQKMNIVHQQQPSYLDRTGLQGSFIERERNNSPLSLSLAAAKVYLEQATSYCEEQKWSEAIQACQQALKIDPNLTEAYKTWGNILQRMGNSTEALGYYAKALELEPELAEVYANVGSIYAQKEKWDNAIVYYQKAIAFNPKLAGAYRNLAKVWTKIGQLDKAEEANRQAILLEPEKASVQELCQIGDRLAAQKSLNEARFYYRQAIKLKPSWIEPYYKLATVAEQTNEWQEAAICYRKIAELRTIELGLVKKALVNKALQTPNLVEFPRLRANG